MDDDVIVIMLVIVVLIDMAFQEELFDFDVGLVDGRQRLNCCINLHEKSFRYYKSKRVLLAFDTTLRLKRWAFRCLHQYSRPSNIPNNASFLPGELLRGNLHIMPIFLQQLREQKVESFISFRMNRRKEDEKGKKLIQLLAKAIKRVRRDGFFKIVKFQSQNFSRQSQIGEKKKRAIDTTFPTGTNKSGVSTPPGLSPRSLNISYTRVQLPLPIKTKENESSRVSRFKRSEAISIRRLQEGSPNKKYTFSAGKRHWERSNSRRNSSFHF